MTKRATGPDQSRDKFTSAVRTATESEQERVAEILGEAFREDPVFNWLLPGGDQTEYYLRVLRALYFKHDAVFLAGDNEGAAMWLPPGAIAKIPIPTTLRLGLRGYQLGGLGCVRRALRLLSVTAAAHPKVPHYYLHAIGTTAEGRGKGLGSQMMRYVLNRADAEGMPAFLENSNEKNMSFYKRHGFEVTEEIRPAPGCPSLWAMWREPRQPS